MQSWQINYRILVYLYSAGLVQMDFTGYTSLRGGRGGGGGDQGGSFFDRKGCN